MYCLCPSSYSWEKVTYEDGMPKDLLGFADPHKQGIIIKTKPLDDNMQSPPMSPPPPQTATTEKPNSFERELRAKERRRRGICIGGTLECFGLDHIRHHPTKQNSPLIDYTPRSKPECRGEVIHLFVAGSDSRFHVKMRKGTGLQRALRCYAERQMEEVERLRLVFEGRIVGEQDTPGELGMINGDEVWVVALAP